MTAEESPVPTPPHGGSAGLARAESVAGGSANAPRFPGRIVAALVGRDLRRFFRQPSRVVGSVAQPLILWVVLGAGMSGSFRLAGCGEVSYLSYFYPGIIVLTVLFTAIFSTISVIDDRHHGFLQAVLVAPVSRAALVLGKTLGGVAIALLQGLVLLLLAPLAGFQLAVIDWPQVLGALALAAIGFCALGFAMAWWIDSTQGYHAVMSVALIPLWMLSGAMFPPAPDSGWLRALMIADPMTYAVSAVRRACAGGAIAAGVLPATSSAAVDLGVAALFAIAAVTAATALCRRRA
ncbi:MAG TPA: ABC transporter permease [Polyangia bacterium]|nr:ABC transporter permease [Polyangia bacterium]